MWEQLFIMSLPLLIIYILKYLLIINRLPSFLLYIRARFHLMLCVKVSYLYIHQDRKGLRQSICSKTRAFTVIIFASQTACIACMQTPWPGKAGPGLWPLGPWSQPTWKSRFHTRSWACPLSPGQGLEIPSHSCMLCFPWPMPSPPLQPHLASPAHHSRATSPSDYFSNTMLLPTSEPLHEQFPPPGLFLDEWVS